MEDSLAFGRKDGQTWIRSANELKTGTTSIMPLHHPYDETV